MKFTLLLLPVLAALGFSSCRTTCPLDPITMRPDCSRCAMYTDPSGCCGHTYVQTTETTYSTSK